MAATATMARLFIQLLFSFPLSGRRFFIPRRLMNGSNWGVLNDLSSSFIFLHLRLCVCACVRAPQVVVQVLHITISPLVRSGSDGPLHTGFFFFLSSCNVTNWADPVRAEDMGINGVESNRAAGVKTIPLQSAAQGGSLGKLCRNEIQTF